MSCNQVLLACNQRAIEDLYQLVMGRIMFEVRSFKAKIQVLEFDYQ